MCDTSKDFEPSVVTPRGLIANGDFGEMKRLKVATPTTPRKNLNVAVTEPGSRNDGPSLDCILMNYIDTLSQRINYHIGKSSFIL